MATTPVETTASELESIMQELEQAAQPFANASQQERATALRAIADALDAQRDQLVSVAMAETHLPQARLEGEVGRTTGQLRMFADGLTSDGLTEAIIDPPDPVGGATPRPDLRRMLRATGPVVNFAASNFPFAFSIAGGDTAAALAAGCPVVVKAHPGHPETSARTAEIVTQALAEAGAPTGVFAVVFGQEAGVTALKHPVVTAGSFTGSLAGGQALAQIAASREHPIPFYAEMGSLNPAFVTPEAAQNRGAEIAEGFLGSFTLGVGQFCTKPGLLFVPRGAALVDGLVETVTKTKSGAMLMERIAEGHREVREQISARPGVRVLAHGAAETDSGAASATLLATDVDTLLGDREALLTECFGPTSLIVEYDTFDDALRAAQALEGSLTATVQAEDDQAQDAGVLALLATLSDRAGRVLWNGWPTGVAVTWAQQHGGPFPATTAPTHTSVGMTAVRRFQRPVAYQDFPQAALPPELRDRNERGLLRRVDGELTTADVAPSKEN